jgi:hypothetical protein
MQQEQFFSTATGGRKHLRQCQHLLDKEVFPVPADDARAICDSCRKELAGEGRTYFDDLDAALEAFRAPLTNRPLIKQALAGVAWDEIWLPFSESYVALGKGGRGVAWSHKTFVEPALGTFIELPGFAPSSRSGGAADRSELWGETCPRTFERHPVVGACEYCGEATA